MFGSLERCSPGKRIRSCCRLASVRENEPRARQIPVACLLSPNASCVNKPSHHAWRDFCQSKRLVCHQPAGCRSINTAGSFWAPVIRSWRGSLLLQCHRPYRRPSARAARRPVDGNSRRPCPSYLPVWLPPNTATRHRRRRRLYHQTTQQPA